MSKKVEVQKEDPVVVQLNSIEGDDVWKVVSPFLLDVCPGPLVAIKKGTMVQLKAESAVQLFYASKIEPLKLAPTFKALRNFEIVGSDGTWLSVAIGDVLRMDFSEALEHLRRNEIQEIKEDQP